MFSLRHLPWFSLLLSCSVYNDALLGDSGGEVSAASGGSSSAAGSSGPAIAQSGRGSTGVTGGTAASEPEQSGGDASGGASSSKPSNAGTSAVSGAGGSGGTAGSLTGSGGAGSSAGAVASGGSTTGAAGTAGAGGTPSPPAGIDLLDDMEDGNFYLSPKPPRYGYWYLAGDMTAGGKLPKIEALVAPLVPPRGASTKAVHFVASGFTDWGASVGLTFADATQKRTPYDCGDALGISFWVRGSVTDNAPLRVLFPTVGSDPSGKTCGGSGQGQCLDHFASQVSVTSDWQQATVLFSSLHQAGWGVPLPAFDTKQVLGIEWTAGVENLDVWIDDLALIRPE